MSNKAAATFALSIAGSFITAVFAYLFIELQGPLWVWCILISAGCTIGALARAVSAKDSTSTTNSATTAPKN